MKKSLVDEIFTADAFQEAEKDRGPVTFWIPLEYKEKYNLLQIKTNRQFGKKLRELFMKSIDKVESEIL